MSIGLHRFDLSWYQIYVLPSYWQIPGRLSPRLLAVPREFRHADKELGLVIPLVRKCHQILLFTQCDIGFLRFWHSVDLCNGPRYTLAPYGVFFYLFIYFSWGGGGTGAMEDKHLLKCDL